MTGSAAGASSSAGAAASSARSSRSKRANSSSASAMASGARQFAPRHVSEPHCFRAPAAMADAEAAPMAVDAAGAGAEASGAAAGKKRFEARASCLATPAAASPNAFWRPCCCAGEEVERRGGVELVHLHGHVRHLPQLAARAVDRVSSQPDKRCRRGALHGLGRLRPRVPPGLHLQVAAHALQLPAVQQGVGVRQDREGAAKRSPRRYGAARRCAPLRAASHAQRARADSTARHGRRRISAARLSPATVRCSLLGPNLAAVALRNEARGVPTWLARAMPRASSRLLACWPACAGVGWPARRQRAAQRAAQTLGRLRCTCGAVARGAR